MNFVFHNPEMLWLLLLLPVLMVLRGRTGRAAAMQFSSVALLRHVSGTARSRSGWILFSLRLLCLAALIVALARPQLPQGHTEELEASGIDIVLVMDLSGSMAGLDLSVGNEPLTRAGAAKEVIKEFIDKRPNDRIGLVVFSTNPYLASPITLNHDWLQQYLDRLHLGIIEDSRTAIGSAIGMATNRLRDLPSKSRVIVLLTDGENNAGNIDPTAAAEAAKTYNIKIYTVAIGAAEPTPLPVVDEDGNIARDRAGRVQYHRDDFGRPAMMSAIDTTELEKIAEITNGKFYRATNLRQLREIYSEIDRQEKTTVKLRHFSTYDELFYWPALVGIGLIALEQVLAHTRLRRLP